MTLSLQQLDEDKRRRRDGVVEDGEYVRFDIMLRDAASGSAASSIDEAWRKFLAEKYPNPDDLDPVKVQEAWKLFSALHFRAVGAEGLTGAKNLTSKDNTTMDSAVALEIAMQRAAHGRKFAWMGDRAPAFDEATARLVATSKVQGSWAREVRDAALANSQIPCADEAAYRDAQSRLSDQRRNAWKGACSVEDVRAAARNSHSS